MIDVLLRAKMTCLVHFEWCVVGMLLLVTLSEYFLYLFYSLLLFYVSVAEPLQHFRF